MINPKKVVFILFFIFISFSTGYADCFSSASERYSIPQDILRAIASTESNNYPFAVNVEGESFYLNSFFDAGLFISNSLDRSFDVGVMQVNRWWFDKMGFPYVLGLNQCWNIHFGAYILNYEMKRAKGDIWKAIGRYHSARKTKQVRYINRVKTAWLTVQNNNKSNI